MIPVRHLDCARVDPTASVTLSDADHRRIEPLQRTLLQPLDYPSVDEWRRDVNRALVRAFDSDAAMFQLDGAGVAMQFSDEYDAEVLARYGEAIMPRLERTWSLYRRAGKIGAGNRFLLWKPYLEWLYDSPYFHDLLTELRAFDPLWASAEVGTEFPAIIHTYHDRRRGGYYFDEKDIQLIALVRPALEAGARTVLRAGAVGEALTTFVDARPDGVLVYDLAGRLLHQNPAVARIAGGTRMERMIVESGRRMARSLANPGIGLDVLANEASSTVEGADRSYRLVAVRVREGVFGLDPVALITVPAEPSALPDRRTLKERYRLTSRQAQVALLLAARRTNQEIADALSISSHTARHHTEAVLSKLGLHDRLDVAATLRGDDDQTS